MDINDEDFAELVSLYLDAKKEEDRHAAERVDFGKQIAAALAVPGKSEGAVKKTIGDFNVTVMYKVNRKVDSVALLQSWDDLSLAAREAFRWRPEVTMTEYKKLGADDTAAAAAFITSSPGSAGIEIKLC